MDYEKLYKEALERARQYHKVDKDNTLKLYAKGTMEYLFPVLKEESEDERIRKEIISALKFANVKGVYDKHIAWLEKQGEQEEPQVYETEDGEVITYSESEGYKVLEPKFKVGDFVVDNCGYVWKIEGILNQFYILEGVEGGESRPTIEWVDKTYHLWTVQDAKDGDVLCDGIDTVIYKKSIYNMVRRSMFVYCGINNWTEYWFEVGGISPIGYLPATKEQRELLFQKMKKAGYEWDAEKKELKKIESNPAWSEEDERNLKSIMKIIKEKAFADYDVDEDNNMLGIYGILESWLKSLKERLKGE